MIYRLGIPCDSAAQALLHFVSCVGWTCFHVLDVFSLTNPREKKVGEYLSNWLSYCYKVGRCWIAEILISLYLMPVQDLGLARSIGVSNMNVYQINRLVKNCRIIPAMNQVECHPWLAEFELAHVCQQHGIHLTAYGWYSSNTLYFYFFR